MTADRVFGVVFGLLGVGVFYMTGQIVQAFPGSGDPGPRLLPTILSLLMILLGALLAMRRAGADEEPVPAGQAGAELDDEVPTILLPPPPLVRRLGIGATFVAFLALFEPLGFSLSSTLFLGISMSLMDALTWRRVATRSFVALVVVCLLGLMLAHVLALPVPGIWFA